MEYKNSCKNLMNRIICLFVVSLLFGATNINAQNFFPADDARIQYHGRWDRTVAGESLLPASGFVLY